MRSKLNPDGSKIRSLRIQRGWTQDQLADIAGISSRTIQRAESADSAAFETVRAIAGAFETDFDQLLKHNTETPDPGVELAPTSELGTEPIAINSSQPTLRHRWIMPLVAGSTLLLGIATGVMLTHRPDMERKSDLVAVPDISAPLPNVERSEMHSLPIVNLQKSPPKKRIPTANTQVLNLQQDSDLKESCGNPVSNAAASLAAGPDSADIIERSQTTASLHDLLPRSQEPIPALVISESSSLWNNIPVPANNPKTDEPDPGVLREAMNTAAKKTGAFVSKAGESIKRVF